MNEIGPSIETALFPATLADLVELLLGGLIFSLPLRFAGSQWHVHARAGSSLLAKGVLAGGQSRPLTVEIELCIPPCTLAEADRPEVYRDPQAFVRKAAEPPI